MCFSWLTALYLFFCLRCLRGTGDRSLFASFFVSVCSLSLSLSILFVYICCSVSGWLSLSVSPSLSTAYHERTIEERACESSSSSSNRRSSSSSNSSSNKSSSSSSINRRGVRGPPLETERQYFQLFCFVWLLQLSRMQVEAKTAEEKSR